MKRSLVWLSAVLALALLVPGAVAVAQPGPGGDRGFVKTGEVSSARRVALVIGNARYKDAPLRNSGNDATAMAKTLRGLGFEVIEKHDLDQRGMKIAIRDFGQKLVGGGVGMFYYAGHAVQVNGYNYLLPVDAQIQSESDVDIESVRVDAVIAQMEGAGTGLNVVVLDACRNNPFVARSFRSATRGLASINAPSGTFIAYATGPDSVAADGEGEHGTYTAALIKHLGTEGLEIGQVFRRVRQDVLDATGKKQVPWESSALTGDFYFKPAANAPPVATPVAARPAAQPIAPQVNTSPKTNAPSGALFANDPEAQELYQRGITAYLKGDCKTAIAAWSIILREHPDAKGIDSVYYVIGGCMARLGDSKGAATFYEKLIKHYPRSESADLARQRLADLKGSAGQAPGAPSNTKIELKEKIYFATGKKTLSAESFSLLDAVARTLQANPSIRLRVEGHTDSEGADKANRQLSQERAEAVVKYLVSKGISSTRLEAVGYGEERPVDSNRTADGRAKNNRVEFTIVAQ